MCRADRRKKGSLQAEEIAYFSWRRSTKTHLRHQEKRCLKNIKHEMPNAKVSVVGDKLIFNGEIYFHYDTAKEWLPTKSSESVQEESTVANQQQELLPSQNEQVSL